MQRRRNITPQPQSFSSATRIISGINWRYLSEEILIQKLGIQLIKNAVCDPTIFKKLGDN